MQEKVSHQEAKVVMVPDGFKIDDTGAYSVDTAFKRSLLSRKREMLAKGESSDAVQPLADQEILLEFFEHKNVAGENLELLERLRDYYAELDALDAEKAALLRKYYLPATSSNDVDYLKLPNSFSLYMGGEQYARHVVSVVSEFAAKNPDFVNGFSSHSNTVKELLGRPGFPMFTVDTDFNRQGELASVAVPALEYERIQHLFKSGMLSFPIFVERFMKEIVHPLAPGNTDKKNPLKSTFFEPKYITNLKVLHPKLTLICRYLLDQQNQAQQNAPEIVPIYTSLLSSVQKMFEETTDLSKAEFYAQIEPTPSLRKILNDLFTNWRQK